MPRAAGDVTRRAFLAAGVGAAVAPDSSAAELPDMRALVEPADLVYERPVPRSEEGIPVGNGRMGSLVWPTPRQIKFQINRVDVYANNNATNSFFERNNDYCGGCGFVDIEFPGDVLPESGFRQHLSVYDGLLAIDGAGATARVLGSPAEDVMAVNVETALPVSIALRMLRYDSKYFGAELEPFARNHVKRLQTRSHTADSQLSVHGDHIILTQDFREGAYCCKSAVAIAI